MLSKIAKVALTSAFISIVACVRIPNGVNPVTNFQLERYLGTWHEIARLDHSFERGLTKVTATYTLGKDGSVNVLNRGYSIQESKWREVEGRAYFVEEPNRGFLKVSFFGPFYGSYIVFELDQENYQYALVSGPDHSYFWILARQPQIPGEWLKLLLEKATNAGFDVDKLIYNQP